MAAEFKITDAIDGNIVKKLKDINLSLGKAKKSYAEAVGVFSQQINMRVDGIGDLEKKSKALSASVRVLNSEQEKLAGIQRRQMELYGQVADRLSKAVESMDRLSSKLDGYARKARSASDALDRYSSGQQRGAAASKASEEAMRKASDAARQASRGYGEILSTLRNYDQRVVDATKSSAKHRLALSGLRDEMKDLKKDFDAGNVSQDEYIASLGLLEQRERELKSSIQQEHNLLSNHAKVVVSSAGSYNEMNAAVLALEKRFKGLKEADRNGAAGQKLLSDIERLKNELKSIDAQMGNYQRNVGNYASGWNGLGFSVQQIARELPSLAMGWNTFFLAVSNNLPMLADEIKRARTEYDEMVKSGQKGTPVWKQLLSSLLGWQTGLVVGITLLSTYGDELVDWGKELFNVREEVDYLKGLQEEYGKAQLEGAKNAQKEVVSLKLLYDATQDQGRSMKERKAAADELLEKYPKYLGHMTQEDILAGRAADSYARLATSILSAAKAQAARNTIVKNSERILELETKLNESYSKREIEQKRLDKANIKLSASTYAAMQNINKLATAGTKAISVGANVSVQQALGEVNRAKKIVSDIDDVISSTRKELVALNLENNRIASSIDINALLFDNGPGKNGDKAKDYASYVRSIHGQLSDLSISGIKNRYERERAEMRAEHEARMAEITGHTEQEAALRKKLGAKLAADLAASHWQEGLEVERADLQNRLSSVEEGSEEELGLRLRLLGNREREETARAREHGADLLAIERKFQEEREGLLEGFARTQADKIAGSYVHADLLDRQDVAGQMKGLAQAYADGEMKKEEYEEAVLDIQQRYAGRSARAAVRSLEEQLATSHLSAEDRAALEEALTQAKIALSDEETRVILENDEKQKRSAEEKKAAVLEYVGQAAEILDGLGRLGGALFEARIQEIEDEQEAHEEAASQELERIERLEESGAITKEQAEARKRAAEAKTEAKGEELEKKKAALQRRQAIWDKANQLAQAAIATALAVTRALPNIALSVLVGAMGAIQIATIAATPIPKYAKGTDSHKGGLAIVGDGGAHELVRTDKGAWLTPDVPTLVDLPRGASVIPDVDIDGMLMKRMFLDVDRVNREAEENGIVVLNGDNTRLEEKIDGLGRLLGKILEKGFSGNERALRDAAFREYMNSKM